MDVLRRYLRRKAPQVAPEPEGGSCQHPQTESCPSSRMAWEAGPGHPRRWSCSALLTGRKPAPRTGAEQRDTTSRPRWRWPKFNLGRQDSAHGRSQATQLWVCFCWKACPQPSRVGQQEASPGQELGDRCLSCLTVAGEESSHSLEVPCNTEAEWSSTAARVTLCPCLSDAETPTNQSEKDLAPEEKAEENEDPAAGEEEEEELETEEEEKQEEQVLITEKEEEMEDLAIKEEEDLTTEEKDEADISVEEEKKEDENMSAEEEEEEEEEENVSAEEEEEEHLSTEEEEDLTTEKEEEEEGKRRGRRR
ncbi:ribosomal biogenesis protein LAS1L-like isoform X3 [Mauremys mutica]|nr:ribosomal biogenesis protein LAS1L-like isoform X3 [Mauremys mutica]XP_044856505.1 ribosomal biogenesis protein LAS1L-like isoform X3 [Mauremys mutica]XP_044857021.1 ribosomal biogenesis protein LAS1L-like isoform X3 [Mauremys mutica]XP_044857185.1 ribosomal biogenesis protein LAS1L-like isoform X3 [Mauremys mutica]